MSFQSNVALWCVKCFGITVATDKQERNFRFFEEATELVQSLGMTKEECLELIEYTYSRPIGEPSQEIGGVMVTLAALATPNGLNMEIAGIDELHRINRPDIVEKIRAKQLTKPHASSLPGVS